MHPATTFPSIKYSVDFEILVAQHKSLASDPSCDTSSSPPSPPPPSQQQQQQHLWTCPADVDDARIEVLRQCKRVLNTWTTSTTNDVAGTATPPNTVIIRLHEEHFTQRSWQSARFDVNVLQPCAQTTADDPTDHHDFDSRYIWHPVKLRTSLSLLDGHTPPCTAAAAAQEYLRVLQTHVLTAVVPKCRLGVSVLSSDGYMTLLEAKKLTSVLWLLEGDMLQRRFANLPPEDEHRRCRITKFSSLALEEDEVSTSGKPQDPLLLAMLDLHLPPKMCDEATQKDLYRIWSSRNLRHLARALRSPAGESLAYQVHIYEDDDADDDEAADTRAVATFHYASVLPQEDITSWLEFALGLARTMALPPLQFKKLLENVDTLNNIEPSSPTDGDARWTAFLTVLGVEEASSNHSTEKPEDEGTRADKISGPEGS